MFEPVRGGTRGGQAEFKWADVSADKDRENYLGHSINAPTGRWQKNKDVHWYNRDLKDGEAERAEEIRKVKELEADALAVALGFEPAKKPAEAAANASPTASTSPSTKPIEAAPSKDKDALEKEERRRKKLEHKVEKRALKELRRAERSGRRRSGNESPDRYDRRVRHADRSRSRSPVPRLRSRERRDPNSRSVRDRSRSRSRTPVYRHTLHPREQAERSLNYEADERERERERDRRRWDQNTSRRSQADGDDRRSRR